jgi:hypothetical protein
VGFYEWMLALHLLAAFALAALVLVAIWAMGAKPT